MISNVVAQGLGPVVKHVQTYASLKEYATERINHHRQQLEQAKDFETVKYHQGAIAELKRIFSLYQEVEQSLKG